MLIWAVWQSKNAHAQLPTIQFVDSILLPYPIQFLTVDNQQNLFYIKPGNEIEKRDPKGALVANFRQRVLGDIVYLDVSNPLKIFIYYNQSNTILQLDNMLNPINQIKLQDVSLGSNSVICRSFDNNFWLYDERNFRLQKYAFDLRQQITGEWLQNRLESDFKPNFLLESSEKLYLQEPQKGIYIFDLYGMYLGKIPLKNISHLQVEKQFMYFLQDQNPMCLALNNPVAMPMALVNNNFDGLTVKAEMLYLYKNNKIFKFKIN